MENDLVNLENILCNILECQIKITNSLNELETMEYKNLHTSKEYQKETEKILITQTKIKRLLEKLNSAPAEIEYHASLIISNTEIKENENETIMSFISLIDEKCRELIKQDDYENEEDNYVTYENYGETDTHIRIKNQIEQLRIINLQKRIDKEQNRNKKQELIEYKFRLIKEDPYIAEELVKVQMNPNLLFLNPDDIEAQILKIHPEKYKIEKENQISQYIEDAIEFLELDKTIQDKNNLQEIIEKDCDFEFINTLLNLLSTPMLVNLKTLPNQTQNYQILNKMINEQLNQREDYIKPSPELLENEECVAVPEKTLTEFISLIKLSELIIEKHNTLCSLEKQNKKNNPQYKQELKTLIYYLEFEKEILDNLEITDEIVEKLEELTTNNLEIFLKNKTNKNIVRKRIENMIPNLIDDFTTSAQADKVAYVINQTYELKTLKELQKIIDKEECIPIKNKLIEEKYKACSHNQCINYDIALTDFEPSNITILDDITTAELLGISHLEYSADKEEELYIIGNKILYEMLKEENKNESYIYYKTICLEEVLKNISLESLLALEEQYDSQIIEIKKHKQDSKQKLKIKSLFKKLKPKYLYPKS